MNLGQKVPSNLNAQKNSYKNQDIDAMLRDL